MQPANRGGNRGARARGGRGGGNRGGPPPNPPANAGGPAPGPNPNAPVGQPAAQGPNRRGAGGRRNQNNAQVNVTYAHNVAKFKPKIRAADSELAKQLGQLNLSGKVKSNFSEANPHKLSAALRNLAIVYALGKLHANGARNVLDVYSSNRTSSLNATLLKGIPQTVNGPQGPIPNPQRMNIINYRPIVVPQDIARVLAVHQTDANLPNLIAQADGFLVVDVYETQWQPMSPSFIHWLLNTKVGQQPAAVLYMIHFDLSGPMGTTNNEGAWIRDGNGLIRYKPDNDKNTKEYPPHSSNEWIMSGSYVEYANYPLALSWVTERAFGDVCVTKFQLIPLDPALLRPPNREPYTIMVETNIRQQPDNFVSRVAHTVIQLGATGKLRSWCQSLLPVVRVPIWTKLWIKLTNQMGFHRYDELKLVHINENLKDILPNYPEMALLMSCFPTFFNGYLENLGSALFVHARHKKLEMMRSISEQNAIFSEYNTLRSDIGAAPTFQDPNSQFLTTVKLAAFGIGLALTSPKWLPHLALMFRPSSNFYPIFLVCKNLALSCITAPVYLAYRNLVEFCRLVRPGYIFNDTTLGGSFINMVILAPLIEEYVKKQFFPAVPLIIGLEFLFNPAGWRGRLAYLLTTAPMHWACYTRSYGSAVLLHAAFNFGVWEVIHGMWDPESLLVPGYFSWSTLKKFFLTALVATPIAMALTGVKRWILNLLRPTPLAAIDDVDQTTKAERTLSMPVRNSCYPLFRHAFYFRPWNERPFVSTFFKRCTAFKPSYGLTPRSNVSWFEPGATDSTWLKPKGAIPLPGPKPKNDWFFWILPTSVPGYVPSRTDENLVSVIKSRILAIPPMSPDVQETA